MHIHRLGLNASELSGNEKSTGGSGASIKVTPAKLAAELAKATKASGGGGSAASPVKVGK